MLTYLPSTRCARKDSQNIITIVQHEKTIIDTQT